jgi:hypothetical protein
VRKFHQKRGRIRDPGSGKNPSRIPDPGGKKAPDPGSRIPDPDPQHWFTPKTCTESDEYFSDFVLIIQYEYIL